MGRIQKIGLEKANLGEGKGGGVAKKGCDHLLFLISLLCFLLLFSPFYFQFLLILTEKKKRRTHQSDRQPLLLLHSSFINSLLYTGKRLEIMTRMYSLFHIKVIFGVTIVF